MLAIEAAAVALKFTVVAPAATVIDAGTVSRALLLASVTLDPPVEAAPVSVTVHLPTAPGPRLAGLQVSVETSPGTRRLMVAVVELVPIVAVTIAV